MKKILLSICILLLLPSISVHALSWAYPFVVWKGNVYEIKLDQFVDDDKIGKEIGEVKTIPDEMTGKYYGNASNYYPKGTKYYEINGKSPTQLLALQENNTWVQAQYIDKAPFHIMNIFTNMYFLILISLLLIGTGIIIWRKTAKKE